MNNDSLTTKRKQTRNRKLSEAGLESAIYAANLKLDCGVAGITGSDKINA